MSHSDLALVIGADGLLGSHLVRELLEKAFSVRVFVHPKSNSPTLDGLPVDRVVGDLLAGDGQLDRAMAGCHYVFHCAAVTDLWASPRTVWAVNLEGTRRVLDACQSAGIQRLVFVGSASSFEYGTRDAPGDESGGFPEAHRGVAYMESKYRATELVRQAVAERGLDAVIVAPTFLLGDLDWRPSSGELIRQFLKRRLRFTSPGGRSFAYAPDVAKAMVAVLDRGERGRSYILGGPNMSYLEFFSEVARIAGGLAPPRYVLPSGAIIACGAAGSLLGRITPWRPPLDLLAARLSLCECYYTSARAVAELGMPQTSVSVAIERSIRSLSAYGHI